MERESAGTIGPGIRSLWVFDFDGTLDPLLSRLSHIPGVDVEDKGWSVADLAGIALYRGKRNV